MRRRRPSDETLVTLRGRLADLPARSPERRHLILGCADLHGVSVATIYRALRDQFRPRSLHRRDRGHPRKLPQREMERFCELVAAIKLRTTNLKNRHLSTGRAIELLVEHGIETPDGLVPAPLPADPNHGEPLFAALGTGRRAPGPSAAGAAVPGRARQ
jgi:hypothetical protein